MSYFIFFILFIFQVQTEAPDQVVFSSPCAWGGSSELSLGGKEALSKKRRDLCLTECETNRSQDECFASQVICCHTFSANNARHGDMERERGKGGEKENECDVYHETGEEESCYVFSDNTCVVCVRVVFAGQCIFHSWYILSSAIDYLQLISSLGIKCLLCYLCNIIFHDFTRY